MSPIKAALSIFVFLPTTLFASPNDKCPGQPFIEDGFLYECRDEQAVLTGCADKQENPIQEGQEWRSAAGSFPGGTEWGFTMKCNRLSDTELGNMPIGCYVNHIEISADDSRRLDNMIYSCEYGDSGKLSLSFQPACDSETEDCELDQ